MGSSCKSSVHCIGSHVPMRATYVSLYRWPESDAEFVRSVTSRRKESVTTITTNSEDSDNNGDTGRRKYRNNNGPAVVDGYSCRQMYLRSYTFSRKENARERTKKCIVRGKERASMFVLLWMRKKRRSSSSSSSSSNKKKRKLSRKQKGFSCSVVGEMKSLYCAAIRCVFHRVMMSCASIPL